MKKVIFYTSWTDPQTYLEDTLKRLTMYQDGRWKTIRGTANPEEADYAVVLDDIRPEDKESLQKHFPPSKRIFLQREPPEIRPKTLNTNGWLLTGTYKSGQHHVAVPWILRPLREMMYELSDVEYKPRDKPLVAIFSNKTKTWGQRQRLKLLRKLCQTRPDLVEVYGRGLNGAEFNGCYKGPIEGKCKYNTLRQYQYCLTCENSSHKNYFTEKLVDCFLSLTVPIYWGCPNLTDFFPKESFRQLQDIGDIDNLVGEIVEIVTTTPPTPSTIDKVRTASFRTLFQWNIWPTIHCLLTMNRFYSQFGQDKRVYELFFKENDRYGTGVFVEVGASDGVTFSNTFFFETTLKWRGVCIEARPSAYEELIQNRSAKCIKLEAAVGDPSDFHPYSGGCFVEYKGWGSGLSGIQEYYDPKHLERIRKEQLHPDHKGFERYNVQVCNLADLLEESECFDIDYLSIDIEGPELKVLKLLDYDRFRIKVITVENNYRTADIRNFLRTKGYRFVERVGVDEIHVRDDLFEKKNR